MGVGAPPGGWAVLRSSRCQPGGHVIACGAVHTIDRDAHHQHLARKALTGHRLANRVTFHTGEGSACLPTLAHLGADIAFFDGYPPTIATVTALAATLRPGGLLIAGNMTLSGQAHQIRTQLATWQHTDLGETLLAVKPE
ncbi:class I SAM-dependent methyltransferase [Streptomyces sp. NPDC054958]